MYFFSEHDDQSNKVVLDVINNSLNFWLQLWSRLDISDESEPSWLEPELELKDIQLGSARLVAFFSSARNRKLAETSRNFDFLKEKFHLCSWIIVFNFLKHLLVIGLVIGFSHWFSHWFSQLVIIMILVENGEILN